MQSVTDENYKMDGIFMSSRCREGIVRQMISLHFIIGY